MDTILIDAKKLENNIRSYKKGDTRETDKAFNEGLKVALKQIEQAPAEEVIKTAFWVQFRDNFRCSHCNSMSSYMLNYCYDCGAKMSCG